jgi:hypothetical protein
MWGCLSLVIDFSAPQVGGTATSLGWFVRTAERDQPFGEEPVLQGSSWYLLPLFSLNIFMVHISPTRSRELNSHHPHSPMRVEGIHTTGWARCPGGTICDIAVATFGTMPHTLASVVKSPVHHPGTSPPTATRTPRVGFWRGNRSSLRNNSLADYTPLTSRLLKRNFVA